MQITGLPYCRYLCCILMLSFTYFLITSNAQGQEDGLNKYSKHFGKMASDAGSWMKDKHSEAIDSIFGISDIARNYKISDEEKRAREIETLTLRTLLKEDTQCVQKDLQESIERLKRNYALASDRIHIFTDSTRQLATLNGLTSKVQAATDVGVGLASVITGAAVVRAFSKALSALEVVQLGAVGGVLVRLPMMTARAGGLTLAVSGSAISAINAVDTYLGTRQKIEDPLLLTELGQKFEKDIKEQSLSLGKDYAYKVNALIKVLNKMHDDIITEQEKNVKGLDEGLFSWWGKLTGKRYSKEIQYIFEENKAHLFQAVIAKETLGKVLKDATEVCETINTVERYGHEILSDPQILTEKLTKKYLDEPMLMIDGRAEHSEAR